MGNFNMVLNAQDRIPNKHLKMSLEEKSAWDRLVFGGGHP